MFPEQLKRILNLIKKTGDKVVVFDASASDDSYVLMNFDSYEGMVSSEKAINNNSKIQTEKQVEDIIKKEESSANISDLSGENGNLTEEDLTDKINREISIWKNRENASYLGEENKPKKPWQIPPQVKDRAQGVE